jgi:hypothetical protein
MTGAELAFTSYQMALPFKKVAAKAQALGY